MRTAPLLLVLLLVGCVPPLFPSKTDWHFPERAALAYGAQSIYRELPETGDPAVAFTFAHLERIERTFAGHAYVSYELHGRFTNAAADTFFVTALGGPWPFMQRYYRAPGSGATWLEGSGLLCGTGLRAYPVAPGASYPFSAILTGVEAGTDVRLSFPFYFAGADSVREALSPPYHFTGLPQEEIPR